MHHLDFLYLTGRRARCRPMGQFTGTTSFVVPSMEEKNSWEETDARGLERLRPCSRRRHGRGRSFGLLAPADADGAGIGSFGYLGKERERNGQWPPFSVARRLGWLRTGAEADLKGLGGEEGAGGGLMAGAAQGPSQRPVRMGCTRRQSCGGTKKK
jgi:hypothetical protein